MQFGKGWGAVLITNSLIGTMEYMAPEVISGSGHGKVGPLH